MVTAWSAAAEILAGDLHEITIRNIVRPAVSGTDLRLHLTNAYGTHPLRFGHVRVGVPSSGPALEAGSNRRATFAGTPEVTLAPGTTAVSDPLPGSVRAGHLLAVSLYLRGPSGTLTGRNRAMLPLDGRGPGAPCYRSVPGDHAGNERGDAFIEGATVWHWLEALTVVPAAPAGVVAALGDSITVGVGSETGQAWPDFLGLAIVNEGISGGKVLRAGTGRPAETRLTAEVLPKPGITTVIVQAGINDVGAGARAEHLIAAYQRMAAAARAAGVHLVIGTLTPFEGAEYHTPAREQVRQEVNTFLRRSHMSNAPADPDAPPRSSLLTDPDAPPRSSPLTGFGALTACDARTGFGPLADFDAVLRDPAHPTRLLPAYDSGDHLHPSTAGHRAMATAVDLRALRPS
ncbi:GDSL-type esterase/lipase family protein [Nonomuraea sp. NPDC004580]|uniref:GDSL-type esterase/lipase family protein n=1 Tax=Nonomuraea sp. NPDC004580 TaxID=3154552 RepID=UPI0033B61B28